MWLIATWGAWPSLIIKLHKLWWKNNSLPQIHCFCLKTTHRKDRCIETMCNRTFASDHHLVMFHFSSFCHFSKPDTCTHGRRQHLSWYSICTFRPSSCILWQNPASLDDRSPLHIQWRPVRSWGSGRSCSPSVSPGFSFSRYFLINSQSISPGSWGTHLDRSGTPCTLYS